MAKQLNVSLAFTADTARVKADIKDLQDSLNKLATSGNAKGELGITRDIIKAKSAAAELSTILKNSMSPSGGLDLSKVDTALANSGKKLSDYRKQLESLGPSGQQAFLKLANSIVSAEAPLKRTNKLLDEFKTSLANTARWQISSSMLHSFMGAIQTAYHYSQDLNKSLNNIRIVTGQTTDQMAAFAKEANKAAQELNTTTTAYTDAALIFYQQGLDDTAVKERTDAVIKLANVTKDSETEVSSYMTAIWNNFAGEKAHLEEYADVITALGAATASSSAEIAGGLQQFAAVGQQIGLSYDYAATALASVVAKTRQSESVVGTAFKTMFARMQGLSQDEEQEDGTDYNKYSKALANVGVEIKKTNGQIKDMDSILDELAVKWKNLSDAERIALAQTVAGTRQYTQFMALMDTMQGTFYENLKVAKGSTGALQEQADIYAESWDAARDRVRSAAEAIYEDLLDDDFFIDLTDNFAKLLQGIDLFIDSIGGLQGVLPGVYLLLTKMYGPSMAGWIDNQIHNIKRLNGSLLEEQQILRDDAATQAKNILANSGTEAGDAQINVTKRKIELAKELHNIAESIDAISLEELQRQLDIVDAYDQQIIKKAEIKDAASDNLQNTRNDLVQSAIRNTGDQKQGSKARDALKEIQDMESASTKAIISVNKLNKEFDNQTPLKNWKRQLREVRQSLLDAGFDKGSDTIKKFNTVLQASGKDFAEALADLSKGGALADYTLLDIDAVTKQLASDFDWSQEETDLFRQHVQELTAAGVEVDSAMEGAAQAVAEFREKADEASKAAQALGTTGQTIIQISQGISQAGMAISAFTQVFDTLANPDMTGLEKFKSLVISLPMAITMASGAVATFAEINKNLKAAIESTTAAESKNLIVKATSIIQSRLKTAAEGSETGGLWALLQAKLANLAVDAPLLLVTVAIAAAFAALAAVIGGVVIGAKAIAAAWETAKEKEEQAQKGVEVLSDRYSELKTEYEELKQAIEDYQDAYNAFQELSEGADNYAESLEKANEAARDLIEQYGLYDQWSYDNKGAIQFDQGALANVRAEKGYQAALAENRMNVAQSRLDYAKKEKVYSDNRVAYDPDTGMRVSGATRDEIDAISALTKEQFKSLQQVTKDTNLDELAKDIGLTVDEVRTLSTAISSLGDDAEIVRNKIQEIDIQSTFHDKEVAQSFANTQGKYLDDKVAQNTYANLVSLEEKFKETLDDNNKQATKGKESDIKKLLSQRSDKYQDYTDYGILGDDELMRAYAQYVEGWSEEQVNGAKYKGHTGSGDLTFGDQTISYDDNYMRQALESALLADQMAQNQTSTGEQIVDTSSIEEDINKIKDAGGEVSDALLGALQNWKPGENIDLDSSLISPEEAERMKSVISEISAEGGSEYATALEEAINNYDPKAYWDRIESEQTANINSQASREQLDLDVLERQTNLIQDSTEALQDNENAAKQLAVNNTRMNKGMEALIKDWDTWKKALKDGDKTTGEYAETLVNLASCIGDLVGLTDNLEASLSEGFLSAPETLELLEQAAEGSAEAVEELGLAVSRDLVSNLEIAQEVLDGFDYDNLYDDNGIQTHLGELVEGFNAAKADVLDIIQEISEAELQVGDNLANALDAGDIEKFVDGLNQMAIATNMSVEDMQAMLNSLGVEANVTETQVEEPVNVPVYEVHREPMGQLDENGNETAWREYSTQTGVETMNGMRTVAAIAYDGSTPSSSINYVGHGGTSSSNQTAAQKRIDKNNKKSGGSKDKKDKKNAQDEIDRYHQIKEVLDDIGRDLNRIDKSKSRTFGAGKVANINKEIAALENETKALQQYQKEVEKYLAQDMAAAQKYGWAIDSNGNVSNYEANMQALINQYNAAVEAYNNSAREDGDKEALKAAEKYYEEAKKALERYEDTSDLLEDVKDKILENARKIADAQLEKIEVVIDLKLKVEDSKLSLLKDLFEDLGDAGDRAADKIENLEKQIGAVMDKSNIAREGIAKMLDLVKQYNSNLSDDAIQRLMNGGATDADLQAIADAVNNSDGVLNYDEIMGNIQDWADMLLDANQQLRQLRDSVFEALREALDKYKSDFEKLDSRIEHSQKLLKSYKDLVIAVGKANVDADGSLIRHINGNITNAAESKWQASASQLAGMEKAVKDAEKGLADAQALGLEADIAKWTKILEAAQENLSQAQEQAMDDLNDWINSIGEAFKDEIDNVIKDLNDSLHDLSHLREQFDQASALDAQYIDDYEKIYELSKLTRQVEKSINETDNIKAKETLMKYQEKINEYQKNGVQMSKYELEYLQAQYEVELAKIALEEAQNAKSQVRMTRDNEGNYSYVYTADGSAIDDASQNYEDKLFRMQQLNSEYIKELQNSIIQMQEECSQKLQEIAESDLLSNEEKMRRMDELREYYGERIDYYSDQLGIALNNNKELYEGEWLDYHEKTGYKISDNEDYVKSWDETTIGILTDSKDQRKYIEEVKTSLDVATSKMIAAVQKYEEKVKDALDKAGLDYDHFTDKVSDNTDTLEDEARDAARAAEDAERSYEDTLGDAMRATQDFTNHYSSKIQECINKNQALIQSLNTVLQKIAEVAAAMGSIGGGNSSYNPGSGGGTNPGSGGGTNPGSGGNTGGGTTKKYYRVNGYDNRGIKLNEFKFSTYAEAEEKANQFKAMGYTVNISHYDTGGYTGDWGTTDGKLALLHQKELVLNQDDTKNMLNIIDMVRDISNVIDLNALSAMSTSGLTAANVNANRDGTLEQNVTITIDAPNLTDKNNAMEIFENAINLAAQYANRK